MKRNKHTNLPQYYQYLLKWQHQKNLVHYDYNHILLDYLISPDDNDEVCGGDDDEQENDYIDDNDNDDADDDDDDDMNWMIIK